MVDSNRKTAKTQRFAVVKLEERHITAAEKLGGGKIAPGIRKALERSA